MQYLLWIGHLLINRDLKVDFFYISDRDLNGQCQQFSEWLPSYLERIQVRSNRDM